MDVFRLSITFTLIACLLTGFTASFTPPFEVWSGTSASGPSLALGQDGILHLAWLGCDFDQSEDCFIYYSNSSDKVKWTHPFPVTPSKNSISDLILLTEGNRVHIFWLSNGQGQHIYSSDNGRSWNTLNPPSMANSSAFSVSPAASSISLLWVSPSGIFYSWLPVPFGAWSPPIKLSPSGQGAASPFLVSSNGSISALWSRAGEVYYVAKPESNTTAIPVSNTIGASESPYAINDSAGGIHVIWRDTGSSTGALATDWGIHYSSFSGAPSPEKKLANNSPVGTPLLILDSFEQLHAVWQASAGSAITYSVSSDLGQTWTEPSLIYSGSPESSLSAIVDANSGIHLAWLEQFPSGTVIRYAFSQDGKSWKTQGLGGGNVSSFSISLDPTNEVQIAYLVSINDSLRLHVSSDQGSGAYSPGSIKAKTIGNCTGRYSFIQVSSAADLPLPYAHVSVLFYNESSFRWSEVSTGLTDVQGIYPVLPIAQGYYRFNITKSGFAEQLKHHNAVICPEPECKIRADCLFGFVCVNSSCIPAECTTDDECTDGSTCSNGVCMQIIECNSDEGCPANYSCISGQCLRNCSVDDDCGDMEWCYANACRKVEPTSPCGVIQNHTFQAYECCSQDDCGSTEQCSSHVCVPFTCSCGIPSNHTCIPFACCSNSDCPLGENCFTNSCIPESDGTVFLSPVSGSNATKIKISFSPSVLTGQPIAIQARSESDLPVQSVAVEFEGKLYFTDGTGQASFSPTYPGTRKAGFSKSGYVPSSAEIEVVQSESIFDQITSRLGSFGFCLSIFGIVFGLATIAYLFLFLRRKWREYRERKMEENKKKEKDKMFEA